ncbi:MAG: heavy metal translocating P-type ATPase [Eubacterium sp.]|nr:heavy metal translocating P-type ATPase [Eubacterium sp.]
MNKKQKKWLLRIVISGVIFAVLFIMEHAGVFEKLPWYISPLAFLVPYLIIGYDVLMRAAKNICHGRVFDENFLMMIATFGAIAVGEYSEAVAVMLFYQVGELFQNVAVNRSRQSITAMMEIVPEYANIEQDGQLTQVDPDDVEIGTHITVLPGERIPLDGVVIQGSSLIDTAALTGESVPRTVSTGDTIISGCINGSGTLIVETTREFDDSTVSKILELVESASEKKAQTENFITRFARYYTPVVTIAAILLAIIPPLIIGGNWGIWLKRACIFLVISCPCALVISVPLGFFAGIGAASRIGVLVKGSNFLELTASLRTIAFDKTGTLTLGEFRVQEIHPANGEPYFFPKSYPDDNDGRNESFNERDPIFNVLRLTAHVEGYSNHPIAVSIREAYEQRFGTPIDLNIVENVEEIAGHGIRATINGVPGSLPENPSTQTGITPSGHTGKQTLLAGNEKLMAENGITVPPCDAIGTIVHLASADDKKYYGCIVIADKVKDGISAELKNLKKVGITNTVMLTGDVDSVAKRIAESIGIDQVKSELLPADKVTAVESLIDPTGNKKVAFVGDGINDAPVLMRADVGIAMGSMGSDAAIEAADIVIMDDDISKIAKTIGIGRKTMRIIRENIVFALTVKFSIMILGALGLANMWLAVFADVGVAVIAILNSMRMLSAKNR